MPLQKNLHLIMSAVFIIPIALVYGLDPNNILLTLFGIKTGNINLSNIFKAMMGLYLAVSAIWIVGIFRPKFWITATLINIIFMGGLACGRLVSLAVDGVPSIYFLTGFVIELLLALWGVINLRKYPIFH